MAGPRSAADYGDRIADVYDERLPPPSETEIEFLADLARGGRVLELGIGTGRVTVPLAERGLEVHGVEASERLIERLWAKPGAGGVTVRIGDFREVPFEGPFALILAVGDTISMLDSQDEQIACFESVAQNLSDGGAFVIEAANPAKLAGAPRVQGSVDGDAVWLYVTNHDSARQWLAQTQVRIAGGETQTYPMGGRYAWPAELDLMARMTGLRLEGRYGGWDRSPFTSETGRYVAVYRR